MSYRTQTLTPIALTAVIGCVTPLTGLAAEETTDWKGEVELGYVQNEGNTEKSSLHAATDIKATFGEWSNRLVLEAVNAESDGERSAERYFFSDRLRREFNDIEYAFGYISREQDRFSGYAYQQTAALGYGRTLLDRPGLYWDAEIGPGFRVSKLEETGAHEEDAIIRAHTQYIQDISDTAVFTQEISLEAGDENTITKSSSELKTKIVGGLGLKISYVVKYTENVPKGTRHADTETALTLIYNFD